MSWNIRKLKGKIKSMKHLPVIFLSSSYFSIVVYLTVFDTYKYLWIVPLLIIGCVFMIEKVLENVMPLKIEFEQKEKESHIIYWIIFLIVFAGQFVYWLAFFPGGFNLDAYGQWDQVHGLMQWNNWHPVFTTFIYWCLTRVIDNLSWVILVQLLMFSAVFAKVLFELYCNGLEKKWILFFSGIIAINPAVAMNNICLIKDVPFAICTLILLWYTLRLMFTKGEYFNSIKGKSILIGCLLAMLMIRHNAILLVVPYGITLAVAYRSKIKSIVGVLGISLGLLIVVDTIVFPAFKIEGHSNFVGEIVGVPMAIMGNSLVNNYENTPVEVREFLEEIADREDWNDHYIIGEWDSCKWEFGGIHLFENESIKTIVELTYDTAKSCPEETYKSIKENTRVVWQILGTNDWNTWIYIEANDYGIKERSNEFCKKIVTKVIEFSNTLIGSMFSWNTGFWIAIYIFILLILVYWKTMRLIPIIIGALAYDFMTMCLLCGPSYRYFYFNPVLIFPLIASVVVIYKHRKIYE